MTIAQRVKQIQSLQNVHTPFSIRRLIGKLELSGDQIWINNGGDQDHGSIDEFKEAAEWIVNQLGGTVKWPKENKK